MNKRVTMQNIADACGVSRNAVSIALRGGGKSVSDATTARIQAKAKELGYVPDPELSRLARRLGQRKRRQGVQGEIPFVVPVPKGRKSKINTIFFLDICDPAAKRMGYHLVPYPVGPDHMSPQQLERIWASRGVQGIFLFSPAVPELVGEWQFSWNKFSWVAFSESTTTPMFHRLNWDFKAAVELCYRRLQSKGYSRIGLIMPDGYDELVAHAGISATAVHHHTVPATQRVDRLRDNRIGNPATRSRILQQWFKEQKPDAVIGSYKTLNHFRSLGYSIPEDLGYASFRLTKEEEGMVCGVAPGYESMGRSALELLCSQIDHAIRGLPNTPILTLIEGKWMDGQTTRSK